MSGVMKTEAVAGGMSGLRAVAPSAKEKRQRGASGRSMRLLDTKEV